jgi:hypothetical protein
MQTHEWWENLQFDHDTKEGGTEVFKSGSHQSDLRKKERKKSKKEKKERKKEKNLNMCFIYLLVMFFTDLDMCLFFGKILWLNG